MESNRIKDRAFENIFSEWPEHKDGMLQWHLAHDSIERKEKFRYFVENIMGMNDQNDLIEKLTVKFTDLTQQAIINCPLVQGAGDFLEYVHGSIAVYLISATPQSNLNEIIAKRGLDKYFKKVYGAPINKVEMLKKIMEFERASVDEILFIGDSPEDQQAAETLEIKFIGRQTDRNLKSTSKIFSDFINIKEYFSQHYGL